MRMSLCLSNSLLPESRGSRQAIEQSAVTVDVPVILTVCRIFCQCFITTTKRGVSTYHHVATEPAVSLSQPHTTKPAVCPSPSYSRGPVFGFPSEDELLRISH